MRQRLQRACDEGTLVRIHRRHFEADHHDGYVVALGEQLFMMALISSEVWLDGFAVVRMRDLSDVEVPAPHHEFLERALRERRQGIEAVPEVSLWNFSTVLRSLGDAASLVTLHQEELEPGVCWIGSVVGLVGDSVELLYINPDARWDESPTSYPLDTITRVEFGGDYEEALALVGGPARRKP